MAQIVQLDTDSHVRRIAMKLPEETLGSTPLPVTSTAPAPDLEMDLDRRVSDLCRWVFPTHPSVAWI